MDTGNHPDPFQDAMNHGLQRAVQVSSSALTAAQAYIYLRRMHARFVAERGDRARRAAAAQIRAAREAARSGWAPALDPRWLRQAGLAETAQAWGAALPYADPAAPWHEPAAATAMRACEERLRELHPHAMARYDRLRADGMAPAEAMRQAAPLFARRPRAHDAPHVPRPALDAGNGENLPPAAAGPGPGEAGDPTADAQERRGRQIAETLQARARAQHRDPLGQAELRTVLETITNLPAGVIDQIARPAAANAAKAGGTRSARPWQHDFPVPIQDVVAAAQADPATAAPAAARHAAARQPARRAPRP